MGLEIVELVMDVEQAYGIKIPDDAISELYTLGDFHNLIARLVQDQQPELAAKSAFKDQLWPTIAHFATRNGYNSKPDSVTRDSRFIEDLGYG